MQLLKRLKEMIQLEIKIKVKENGINEQELIEQMKEMKP